jgi:flagellar basal body rod protein FlgF
MSNVISIDVDNNGNYYTVNSAGLIVKNGLYWIPNIKGRDVSIGDDGTLFVVSNEAMAGGYKIYMTKDFG